MVWKLTDLARSELMALARDGVEVTPQDILDIQAYSCQAIATRDAEVSFHRGTPVSVGGFWLYPLTIAGTLFFDETGSMFLGRLEDIHLAYTMVYGSDAERMRERDPRKVRKAVRRFARELTCTRSELSDAIDRVTDAQYPPPPPPPPSEKGDDEEEDEDGAVLIGDGLRTLATELEAYGVATAKEIECLFSVKYAYWLLRRLQALREGVGEKTLDDTRIEGLGNLARCVKRIRDRKQESENNV